MKIILIILKKIIDYFYIGFYYILLLLGLITTSWIIWARFIRTRTIRDIPDYLLTEYRFWILLYICFIYVYIVKNLIKPSTSENMILQEIIKEFVNLIFKPLKTLDHAIKYNKYVKPYYYKIMFSLNNFVDTIVYDSHIQVFIFLIQIFPRIILVTFLFFDTFYFNKLEIFYKVILIGLLPFLLRYVKYSLKDILEQWILELENKYQCVGIYEKGYQFDKSRVGNTKAVLHDQEKPIREYIEIKFNNNLDYLGEDVDYEYESNPYPKNEIYDKYKTTKMRLRVEDLNILKQLYYELMPQIINMKLYLYRLEVIDKTKIIKWSKVIIFSMYLICWSFILIISYFHFPIELQGIKYLLVNFISYLCNEENPFAELYWGSRNKNLITKESMAYILHQIINKFS